MDRIEFEEGQISGINLKAVDAEFENGRYKATGSLAIKDGVVSGSAIGPLNGDLVADNKSVRLTNSRLRSSAETHRAISL